jgi:hypothetical protein
MRSSTSTSALTPSNKLLPASCRKFDVFGDWFVFGNFFGMLRAAVTSNRALTDEYSYEFWR